MTFTAAIVTGLGFFTGVLIGWALVFAALLIAFGIHAFFTRKKNTDDDSDNKDWERILNEPAYMRRD